MTDEPTHLTDIDLFPEHAPKPRGPEADPEKARFVLEMLTAAGLKSPFGIDIDRSEEVWGIKLAAFDIQTLTEAVDKWISEDTNAFPAVGELVSLALRIKNRRNAIKAAHDHPIPGQLCMECGGQSWVDVDEGAAIGTVRPCSVCRADQYQTWKSGGYMPKVIRETTPEQQEASGRMLREMRANLLGPNGR